MPIYEYYCPACDVRFSHLARGFDGPPPCPRCGSDAVTRLVSSARLGRSEEARRADLEARSRRVDRDDPAAMARFLHGADDVLDEVAPIDPQAFREIVARRAEGAGDADLQDVVDAMPFPTSISTGSLPAPEPRADGACCDHHDHHHHHGHGHGDGHAGDKARNPRRARDVGWAG